MASSSRSWKYDVFLSFRGEDTRKTYVDHLYSALVERQIRTYKDNETLPRGDSISPSLLKAIEESQIAVIIFSENYANSSWCLDELEYIMKCRDGRGQIVIPIFYKVDPSDVRKLKGEFGRAFAKRKQKNRKKTESWRKTLFDASNIAGWEPTHIANGHESIGIKKIVDTILDKLFSLNSDVEEDLVGMGTRLQSLKSLLEIGLGGVHMVGLWGVGGSGKTTLAYCAYTQISHHFEGHCIIDNIREESTKHGLKNLQEKVLSILLKTEVTVESIEEGKSKIRSRLCRSNVLIVLDDVDDDSQLEALAGSHKWFGNGSRIIITTRDEHLLRKHKVNKISPANLLSLDEAIRLFNWHANQENNPIEDHDKLSLRVVSYADGLPLALKVLGSFLCDKDKKEWISTLDKLKDIPNHKINDKLKISYDGLEPDEKELFLDIACFFRRTLSVKKATMILDASGFHPGIGIRVLRQKALITISNGMFDMHDLVQEMGHYIVRGQHPRNPEKHSRVWNYKQIQEMCSMDTTAENDKIEAISLVGYLSGFPKVVSNMKKLRFLNYSLYYHESLNYDHGFNNENLSHNVEGPSFLSNELRCIHYHHYPRSPFPATFQPKNLVVLQLHGSLQKELWQGYKHLPHLKELDLKHAENLLSTPDFDGLPCLEKLSLEFCESLEAIHPSLGTHKSLVYVVVSLCEKLRTFPTIVCMKKLETLKIEYCKALLEFPEIQGSMDSLVNLTLVNVGIEVLPSSIGAYCTNLTSLKVEDCEYLKSIEGNFQDLKQLQRHESIGIKKNVDTTLDKPFPLISYVSEHLVGMGTRLQSLKSLLEIESGGVHMVGICGVGGSGKTTLAHVAYTQISHHFEGHCIIDAIREISTKHGLKNLQEKVLSTLLKTDVKVQSVEEGKSKIRSRLCRSNVLIVLDDVDDDSQLEALVGSHKWFGNGSRIIITTRDEHLLRKHKVNKIYPVRLLSHDEAIQLFCQHGVQGDIPIEDYNILSERIVYYARGIPLTIRVLCVFLYGKDNNESLTTLAHLVSANCGFFNYGYDVGPSVKDRSLCL